MSLVSEAVWGSSSFAFDFHPTTHPDLLFWGHLPLTSHPPVKHPLPMEDCRSLWSFPSLSLDTDFWTDWIRLCKCFPVPWLPLLLLRSELPKLAAAQWYSPCLWKAPDSVRNNTWWFIFEAASSQLRSSYKWTENTKPLLTPASGIAGVNKCHSFLQYVGSNLGYHVY